MPAPLGSLLAIWGVDKEKLEDVAGRDAGRNVSRRVKNGFHALLLAKSPRMELFLRKYCNMLSCRRVREGSRPMGVNAPSLAPLTSGGVLLGGIPV